MRQPISVRIGTVAAAVAVLATACTASAPPQPPTPGVSQPSVTATGSSATSSGGTLRYALGSNPASIDPRYVNDESGMTVVDALFDSLVAMDPTGARVVPAAAQDWSVSDDGRTYRFTLRRNGRYDDGSRVVAADFVRSFRQIVDPDRTPRSFLFPLLSSVRGYSRARSGGAPLSGVQAADSQTFVIQLARPQADLLRVLTHPGLAPVPAAAADDPGAYAERPVGNGPFAMAEPWQQNQFIRVVRVPDHVPRAVLDEVVFQIFADDPSLEQQYDDFRNGRVDVAQVPTQELDTAATTYGRSLDGVSGPGLIDGTTSTLYYLGFNTRLPPFDDPSVRRALAMLVDRDGIVEDVLLDAREAAHRLVAPPLAGDTSVECTVCRFDPSGAREELDLPPEPSATPSASESSSTVPLGPIELAFNTGGTNRQIADRVAADIRTALGIEVTTRAMPLDDLVTQVQEGNVGMFRLGWQAEYPSAGAILQPLFRSDAESNVTGFSDRKVDQLLDQARATTDLAARSEVYARAEQRILDLAPVIPVFFYRRARVVASTVRSLRISPVGTVNLATVSKQASG